jgi:hypothetical protein
MLHPPVAPVIRADALQPYLDGADPADMEQSLRAFIRHQCATWPGLLEARRALAQATTKEMFLEHLSVAVQHNPRRVKSVAADVDERSIRARPCFLCPDSLYPHQMALPFLPGWYILNNPFPIFSDHLVITAVRHRPQTIGDELECMVAFVRQTNAAFMAFYNGPDCGASAPDHLHFQACPAGSIPLPQQVMGLVSRDRLPAQRRDIENSAAARCLAVTLDNRGVFFCLTGDDALLCRRLRSVLAFLRGRTGAAGEPMVNLMVSGHGTQLLGMVFPRRAHRPACFFRSGAAGLLVSPGAVDVGGLTIVPRAEDFKKITAADLLDIYAQVCHSHRVFDGLDLPEA